MRVYAAGFKLCLADKGDVTACVPRWISFATIFGSQMAALYRSRYHARERGSLEV